MLTAALAFRIADACFFDCSSACGPISPCELAFIPDSPRALGLGLHMLMQLPPYAYAVCIRATACCAICVWLLL